MLLEVQSLEWHLGLGSIVGPRRLEFWGSGIRVASRNSVFGVSRCKLEFRDTCGDFGF